jgi:hypothetical protein
MRCSQPLAVPMHTFKFYETVLDVCHPRHRQRWLSSVSLDVWQAQSRAGVYAEASAIVYTLGQSRGVTAIAKIAGGLVLLRM